MPANKLLGILELLMSCIDKRSKKSKEKFADSLMTIANTVHGAALVSVLVFPLTVIVSSMFSSTKDSISISTIFYQLTWTDFWCFSAAYLIPIAIGVFFKKQAMDWYDKIEATNS